MIRRSIFLFAIASTLALVAPLADAQVVCVGPTCGGGTATDAGSSLPSCGASSILTTDASKLLACNPASVVNGSVSTAGRSILTIKDTITGSSATSNFLNITGTFPATLTTATYGVAISTALDNDAQTQAALQVQTTGTGPSAFTAAIIGDNTSSSSLGAGLLGSNSGANTTGYGVLGYSTAGTNKFGGFFSLAYPGNPTGTAALVCDNNSVAADCFQARDNANVVWAIADGGYIQGTRGEVALNGDYTNATATFSSTALSVDVVSGRTYSFNLDLMLTDSTAADGAKIDFNGGSAAATIFRVGCSMSSDTGTAVTWTAATATALATTLNVGAMATTAQHTLRCVGTFVPSGSGTFIVRAAQNAHSTGTLTIHRGSFMSVRDSRPL